MQLPDGTYRFGRVIDDEAVSGFGPPSAVLIYIYRAQSQTTDVPERSQFTPDQFLTPPMMANRLPWSRGYFQTITHLPLEAHEVLDQHCFRSWTGDYFDHKGIKLHAVVEPCGDYGLHSFRTIDDAISDALGLPRAPE